jgi:DNA-binding transcriptional regulator WhiA
MKAKNIETGNLYKMIKAQKQDIETLQAVADILNALKLKLLSI